MQTQRKTGNNIHYDRVLSAWREQVTTTANGPDLKQRLVHQERELLPRFAAQYSKLSVLPRTARRAMQRQWKRSLAGVALLLALGQTPAMAATINVSGGCSLVNAITAANTDTATGGCAKGSGRDTIVLPRGSTQTLTAVNNSTYYAGNGLPVVTSTITIQGNGATIRRAGSAPNFRIFAVAPQGKLKLQQTAVSGGKTDGGTAAKGGALYDYGGIVTVTNSTISGNSASGSGGGIYSIGGSLTLTNSTVSGNSSGANGGGIRTYGALTLKNTTITRNSAKFGGGGVGVFISSTTLHKTLVSGNTAPTGREINDSTPSGTSGTFTANDFNVFGFNGNAGVSGFTPGATDIVPRVGLSKVLNTTLANNGGPTRTHALPTGSPAIDSVSDGTCPPPARDQRGTRRPRDGNGDGGAACDTGSVER